MVEVTPGAKSISSSSFSIDAIISKDGGGLATSPVPYYTDAGVYPAFLQRPPGVGRDPRGSGPPSASPPLSPHPATPPTGTGTVAPPPQHSMDVVRNAHVLTSMASSQLPPHHPHFPSPALPSSQYHHHPHHPPPHPLLGVSPDSASFFSAAAAAAAAKPGSLYSTLPSSPGGLPGLHDPGAAHTAAAGLFGQSPLAAAYSGMSQAAAAAAAAEASGLSTLHALSQKSAALHAGSAALHGLAAGGAVPMGGVHHRQFPLYTWLSRPGAYFHRYTGSEPSFLLPFRKPKRIRTAFSPSQLLRLEHAFEKNHYVVGQERKDLAVNLSLTETQVKVWFQNRRTKHKRLTTEEEQEKNRGNKSSPDNSKDEDDMDD